MKIALVYTGAGVITNLSKIAREMYPDSEIMNLLDDTLIGYCMKAGYMTKDVELRLINIFQYAYHAGADYILLTCSSVGDAADLGNSLVPVPIIRIDQPMCEAAISTAETIGVVGSLSTTLEPTSNFVQKLADIKGKKINIERGLAKGAYEAGVAGNFVLHDKLIEETAIELSDKCDAIILAQASMARMEERLAAVTGKKVFSSPVSGIAQIKNYIL